MSNQTHAETIRTLANSIAQLAGEVADYAAQAAQACDSREAVGALINTPETLASMQALVGAVLALNRARG